MSVREPLKLEDAAFRNPTGFRKIVTTADYRRIVLTEQGRIIACGHCWDIKGRSLGAGLYEITLTTEGID